MMVLSLDASDLLYAVTHFIVNVIIHTFSHFSFESLWSPMCRLLIGRDGEEGSYSSNSHASLSLTYSWSVVKILSQ